MQTLRTEQDMLKHPDLSDIRAQASNRNLSSMLYHQELNLIFYITYLENNNTIPSTYTQILQSMTWCMIKLNYKHLGIIFKTEKVHKLLTELGKHTLELIKPYTGKHFIYKVNGQ